MVRAQRVGLRSDRACAGRRRRRVGCPPGGVLHPSAPSALRGRDGRSVVDGTARRAGPLPATAVPGSGDLGAHQRPGGRGRTAAHRRRARAHHRRPSRRTAGRRGGQGGLANVHGSVAMLRAELARHRGDVEHTIRFAQLARAHADEGDRYLRFFTSWNLAVAKQMQGRVGEAEDALAELAADPWATRLHRYFAVRTYYTLGQVQRAQGRLSTALRTCLQGLELAAEAGRPTLPAAGVAHVGIAEVLYERNELNTALRHATEGVALCGQLGYAQWLVTSLTTLARIRQALGDQTGALEAIGEAERLVPYPAVDIFFPVGAQRARLLVAQGKVEDAARWCAERGLGVEDEPSYLREREHLLLARVLLAQGKPDQVLMLLERLREKAQAGGGGAMVR